MSETPESSQAIESWIQAGELEKSLDAVERMLAEESDGGVALLAAVLQTQLERFDTALGTLEALASRAEAWRGLAQELTLCVVAEKMRAERTRDPDAASKRAGIAPPPEFAQWQLEAAVYHAAGEHDEAKEMLERARAAAPTLEGRVIETSGRVMPFTDLCDTDDLTGPMLQAIGPRGLLDIPFSDLASVALRIPRTYHDVLWQVADIETRDGVRVVARIPSRYPGTGLDEDAPVRAGKMTSWDRSRGYAVAVGQRDLRLEGESATAVGLSEIARIEIDAVAPPPDSLAA